MGAIVSGQRHLQRPASASVDGSAKAQPLWRRRIQGLRGKASPTDESGTASGRGLRPVSAPPCAVVEAERSVELARRAEALQQTDALQADLARESREGRHRRSMISPEQEAQLGRLLGEAMVDQVLHEGEGAYDTQAQK